MNDVNKTSQAKSAEARERENEMTKRKAEVKEECVR